MTRAAEIARALGGARRSGNGWLCRCPVHDDHDPSLSVTDGDDGKLLVYCHAGCGQEIVCEALRARGLWPDLADRQGPCPAPPRVVRREADHRADRRRIAAARHLWRAGRPITPDDPAGRYLTGRSLPGPWPPTLRFLAAARHPSCDVVSALVAAACRWPDRKPVAVQLTGLTADARKAPVSPERWTHGVLRGAAVRLSPWDAGEPVILVEGVEDGLAVLAALPGACVWVCLGAGNAAHVALPEGTEALLCLDGDDPGRREAREAVAALTARGHRVRMADLPVGFDPNSLLTAFEVARDAA